MAGDYIAYPALGGGGGGGSGTVTSVGLTMPAIFAVVGSPITTAGTLAVSLANQSANRVWSGPSTGAAATPTFRALVGADLPNPSSSTLGGIQSAAAVSNQWINSISTSGVPALSQPAFSNISGSITGAQLPTFTGDVTNVAAAMTVAKIQTTTVSGTTGTGNVVFSASPTLTGTMVAAAANLSGTVNLAGLTASQAVFTDGSKNLVSNAITGTGNVVMSASPTLTGTITAASATVSGTLQKGNYHIEPLEYDAGNSSTAQTLDWANGSSQKSTLTGNVTYTLSNPVTGGAYVIKIATGAGSFTVTWPSTVKWASSTAPTITTTAGRIDLISLYWDGTDYFGTFSQNYTP